MAVQKLNHQSLLVMQYFVIHGSMLEFIFFCSYIETNVQLIRYTSKSVYSNYHYYFVC